MNIKGITHHVFAFVYLGLLVVSVLIIGKPGASIFYYRQTLESQNVQPDSGYAYRYDLRLNTNVFRTKEILIYENGQALKQADGSTVISNGKNTYSLEQPERGLVYVYFASSDNSDPITNGRIYTLYIPLNVFTRSMGFLYLALLMPGLAGFIYFAFVLAGNRQALLQTPGKITAILDQYFIYLSQRFSPDRGPIKPGIKSGAINWKKLFIRTVLAAYIYVLMEWIFFATKPSFMSTMSVWEQTKIYFVTSLFFTLLALVAVAIIIGLDLLLTLAHLSGLSRLLMGVVPAIILSTLTLLLIDNFTYTIFKFGISTSKGNYRIAYAILFMLLFSLIYLRIQRTFYTEASASTPRRLSKRLLYTASSLLILSFGVSLTGLDFNNQALLNHAAGQQTGQLPNIILLGSDGLNAENMSVYGYGRDTTPRIRELAQSSLMAENAFSNSSNTGGSVISIFTSKLPTETRVVYAPDILTGKNAYQHLPGMLNSSGYKTIELGVPNYADAYSFNVLNGFDSVNGVTQENNLMEAFLQKLGYDFDFYFLHQLRERAFDRLQHIFFIKDMQNPYQIVTHPTSGSSDLEKIDQMLDVIEGTQEPVFVHVHLMGTHGPMFIPNIQHYSKDELQDQAWMTDFYDDAMLSFDDYVGNVVDRLKVDGEYDNTILIIYSDHASNFRVNARIPLLIHFPGDWYAGIITQNVQNLDIAPTVLDYLGITEPGWMEGASLLNGELDSHRLIFSAGTGKVTENAQGAHILDLQQVEPPFYQFSIVTVIDCQRWSQLSLMSYNFYTGEVNGYSSPCNENSLLSKDQARRAIAKQLSSEGFDISSLP